MADPATSGAQTLDPLAGLAAPWMLDPPLVSRHLLSTEAREGDRRNRLLRGALDSLAERGYPATSVASIADAAGLSRYTFHTQFPDKETCVLCAYDLAVAWLEREVSAAVVGAKGWPEQVRGATEATLALLATDPPLACLLTGEILCLGRTGEERRRDLVDRLVPLLRLGRAEDPGSVAATPRLEQALIHGAIAVVDRELSAGRGECLAHLAPGLSEFLLAPYLEAAPARTNAPPPGMPAPVFR